MSTVTVTGKLRSGSGMMDLFLVNRLTFITHGRLQTFWILE